ncbi:MAG: DinB family protein [Armatimonadota bacterium]|nr:DinB family protein [Armatimonadota bacterium]MDR7454336.1 DinB family protein [Armatimonadota bacterium]MDR7512281.1 DinB family protein [Armatimonadota bacterium]
MRVVPRYAVDRDQALREHLIWQLGGGHAHVGFDAAVAGLPLRLQGARPPGIPYSPWMLLEHLRISQWDIVEFSRDPGHVSPRWPAGYWPARPEPPSPRAWARSVAAFRRDLRTMIALVRDPKTDLYARLPHGRGHTVLREVILLVDHNAYHLGQLIAVRRMLGAWKG